MVYMPVDKLPICNFLHCCAGQGLAGRGVCFLNGDWADPDCSKFENEAEYLKEWEKREKEKGD